MDSFEEIQEEGFVIVFYKETKVRIGKLFPSSPQIFKPHCSFWSGHLVHCRSFEPLFCKDRMPPYTTANWMMRYFDNRLSLLSMHQIGPDKWRHHSLQIALLHN